MLAASCLLSACRAPSLGESVRLIPHAACRPRMPSAAMMLDIDIQGLAAAPPAVQAAATVVLAVGAAVGTGAVGGRRISFSSLDERKAVSYLQGFPSSAFALWSTVEWGRLGVDQKLEFSTTKLDNGVRINYFLTPAQARERGLAGVQQDGGFELTVDGNAIVGRADPGRINRKASEEVIWQRLLLQITKGIAMERAGARPDIGTVRGVYPCSMEKEIAYMALRRASDSLWKRY